MLQDQFKPAIQIKHEGLLLKGAARLHYNAHPHTSAHTTWTFRCWSILLIISDLAPSDYYLFGPLKDALRGCHFTSHQEVRNVVHTWLTTQPETFYWGHTQGQGLYRKIMLLYILIVIVLFNKKINCGCFLTHPYTTMLQFQDCFRNYLILVFPNKCGRKNINLGIIQLWSYLWNNSSVPFLNLSLWPCNFVVFMCYTYHTLPQGSEMFTNSELPELW
jgi:hypothetical protein